MKFTVEKIASMPMFWRTLTPFESAFIGQQQIGSVDEESGGPSEGWDLISETAFMLATETLPDDQAFAVAKEKIARLDNVKNSPISSANRRVVYQLRDAILSSIESFDQETRKWMPVVPGFAALRASEADLLCGDLLVEFKCVSRNFSPRDVRQVLLYSAILAETGKDVSSFAILNPRMGCSIRAKLQDASLQLSGRPWVDTRLEILSSIESYSRIFVPNRFESPN
ncbi:hypothetical protein [Brevibacterium marinum]|uniref:Uncharacterized protein n=1 Tax=Brevibacterium marinum TaxID=418643 RepID=A0A846S0T2_9MICO|nr:hypothetical protein [Brevibacterium marinum]NJC57080.1 hypothetical protein [Brevibacterium marinum]